MDGFCYFLSGIFCLGGGFNETGDALRLLLTAACNGCARCACCHHRCCWVPNGRQRRSACSRSRPIWAVLKTPLVSDWFLVNIGVLLAEPMKNGSAQFVAGIATNQSSRTSALIWFWIIFPSAALVPRIQHMCSLPETWLPSQARIQTRNQVVSKFWTSEISGFIIIIITTAWWWLEHFFHPLLVNNGE